MTVYELKQQYESAVARAELAFVLTLLELLCNKSEGDDLMIWLLKLKDFLEKLLQHDEVIKIIKKILDIDPFNL